MKFIQGFLRRVMATSLFLLLSVSVAYAGEGKVGTISNPLGSNGPDSIQAFILKFLEGVIQLGIPIVALAVIYCGFLFVKAQGNPEELTKAKEALIYTLIGAAILLGAIAITKAIIATVASLAT